MRKFLLAGHSKILDVEIGTLIYGSGTNVSSKFSVFPETAEPYMLNPENKYFYLGDLDYAGIVIYESLAEVFSKFGEIKPFIPGYLAMLKKGETVKSLPITKEGQNRNNKGLFFSFFGESAVSKMKSLLTSDRYIPQEILNIKDY